MFLMELNSFPVSGCDWFVVRLKILNNCDVELKFTIYGNGY